MAWGLEKLEQKQSYQLKFRHYQNRQPKAILLTLLRGATENQKTIVENLEILLTEYINRGSESISLLALEISICMRSRYRDKSAVGQSIYTQIYERCFQRIQTLYPKSILLFIHDVDTGQLTFEDFLKWYGFKGLFQEYQYIIFPQTTMLSIAEVLLSDFLMNPLTIDPWIEKIGYMLINTPLPCLKLSDMSYTVDWRTHEMHVTYILYEYKKIPKLESDVIFGLFSIISIFLEFNRDNMMEVIELLREDHINNEKNFFHHLYWTFIARFQPEERDKVQAELDQSALTEKQQAFVWKWVRREINFVEEDLLEEIAE